MSSYLMKSLLAALVSAELKQFRSGSMTSAESFRFGKFRARMKAPNKPGTVSAFFTYWTGAGGEA